MNYSPEWTYSLYRLDIQLSMLTPQLLWGPFSFHMLYADVFTYIPI